MNTIKLPPLPSPFGIVDPDGTEGMMQYTTKDLQDYAKAYALAAIEADRQVRGGDQINQKQPETRANTGLGGGDQRAAFETEMRKDLGIPDHLELNWEAEYVATSWKYYQAAFDQAQTQNDQDLRALVHERARADRLQRILDSRPALNAGLPQTYIEWSQSIYIMDTAHARETPQ